MKKLVEDISNLTKIPQAVLSCLVDNVHSCICHDVYENILERNNLTEVDLGIGTLYIKCEENDIKYKFIPSRKLEKDVAQTVQNKVDPLLYQIETSLKERIESTYKKLL